MTLDLDALAVETFEPAGDEPVYAPADTYVQRTCEAECQREPLFTRDWNGATCNAGYTCYDGGCTVWTDWD